METQTEQYDLIIIGLGPVGLLAANCFGQLGHRVLAVDKIAAGYNFPRAIHLDAEILRILQFVDLSAPLTPLLRPSPFLELCDRQFRPLLRASIPFYSGYVANDFMFFQPELEEILKTGAARFRNVTLAYQTEVTELVQDDQCVTISANGGFRARATFLVACDGAKSMVRNALGIRQIHFGFEKGALKVDGLETGEDSLVQSEAVQKICSHQKPWVRMKGRGAHRRWELNYAMTMPREEYEQPETVKKLLGEIGVDTRKLEILHAVWYRFRGVMSREWRKGRVFLAGDAAHATPPYIGQGMCAGFRDVLNLAWKLDAVRYGARCERLLDTYTSERLPQVRIHILVAIAIGHLFTSRLWYLLRGLAAVPGIKNLLLNIRLPLDPQGRKGVWGSGNAKRQLFPQFKLRSGGLSDLLLEKDWALVAVGTAFSPEDSQKAANIGLRTVAFDRDEQDIGALLAWAEKRKACFFIVRPDLYVFSSGRDAGKLIQAFEKTWMVAYRADT
ncbi:MAG: FAD-dependent monooxygenase [Saprospiraceae bacterium]